MLERVGVPIEINGVSENVNASAFVRSTLLDLVGSRLDFETEAVRGFVSVGDSVTDKVGVPMETDGVSEYVNASALVWSTLLDIVGRHLEFEIEAVFGLVSVEENESDGV